MKIAYIVFHDITRNDGVTKKVKGQVDEWVNQSVDAKVFCFLPKKGESILNAEQFESGGYFNLRLRLNSDFILKLNSFDPDIIYFRYDLWNKNLIYSFKNRKSVAELNSLDLNEFYLLLKTEKSFKSVVRYLGYLFGRYNLLKQVNGFVSVTNEIVNHYSFKNFKKPNSIIPNGIDFKSYNTIKSIDSVNEKVSLFFIGTPNQPWQGEDIIVEWSKKLSEFDFHIVGMGGENSSNLFFHGYLEKLEYLKILKSCQICIGTLALSRKQMTEACPLKVREYLAYGYPTILGFSDTSFIDNSKDFLLELNENSIFDFDSIRNFVNNMKYRVVDKEEIEELSTENLETKRISFFKKILS